MFGRCARGDRSPGGSSGQRRVREGLGVGGGNRHSRGYWPFEMPITLAVTVSSDTGPCTCQWYDWPSPVPAIDDPPSSSVCTTLGAASGSTSATTYYATSVGLILELTAALALTCSFPLPGNTVLGTSASASSVSAGLAVYNMTGVTYQWYDRPSVASFSSSSPPLA